MLPLAARLRRGLLGIPKINQRRVNHESKNFKPIYAYRYPGSDHT